MSRIRSAEQRSKDSLDVLKFGDGTCGFGLIDDKGVGWGIRVVYDKVLAALGVPADWEDLVTKAKRDMAEALIRAEAAETKLTEAERERDDTLEALGDAAIQRQRIAAERDALAATVDRAREATKKWSVHYRWAGDKILAALAAPEPAFVLPTEAGVRFEAQGNDDMPGSLTGFVTLVGAGRPVYMAVDDVDCVYEAEGVMRHYTGHRLIEGAEGA